jgi:serine/threonine protein kinase
MAKAVAQRVLQCVARVHEVGWVHLDLKPDHFLRFPGGQYKLVDYGSAHRAGATAAPLHSRRYCAPELARQVDTEGRHALRRVEPGLDVWAAGAVLYALFCGRPLFPGDAVSYAEIYTAAASGAVAKATRDNVRSDNVARLVRPRVTPRSALRAHPAWRTHGPRRAPKGVSHVPPQRSPRDLRGRWARCSRPSRSKGRGRRSCSERRCGATPTTRWDSGACR